LIFIHQLRERYWKAPLHLQSNSPTFPRTLKKPSGLPQKSSLFDKQQWVNVSQQDTFGGTLGALDNVEVCKLVRLLNLNDFAELFGKKKLYHTSTMDWL